MIYSLLGISMLACLVGFLTKKIWCNQYSNAPSLTHLYNAITSIISALSIWIFMGLKFPELSWFTVLLGVVFGIVTALQAVFMIKAFEKGSFSYTSVLISLSTIIPTLSGVLFFHETISPIQIVGIAFMMVCFVCSVEHKGSEKKASWIWLLYVGVAFLMTGVIGILQKWHQSTVYRGELDGFLLIAFVISFFYSGISFVALNAQCRESSNESKKSLSNKLVSVLLLIVFGGICVAANNKINLYLSGVMDSAVFFPVVNGGGLILSTISSLVFFKEKPTVRQWIGMVIGIVAVVLLCNPF